MCLLAGCLGSFQKETTGKTSHLNRLPNFKEFFGAFGRKRSKHKNLSHSIVRTLLKRLFAATSHDLTSFDQTQIKKQVEEIRKHQKTSKFSANLWGFWFIIVSKLQREMHHPSSYLQCCSPHLPKIGTVRNDD